MVSHLWVLGLLGNRGVERERIIRELSETVKAPEPEVRHWSIEALAARGKTPRFRPREASAWPAARRLNLAPSPGIS